MSEFLYKCAHIDKIRQYINKTIHIKWQIIQLIMFLFTCKFAEVLGEYEKLIPYTQQQKT